MNYRDIIHSVETKHTIILIKNNKLVGSLESVHQSIVVIRYYNNIIPNKVILWVTKYTA